MGAARLSRLQTKPTPPITGRLGRVRCRGYLWLVVLAFATPRRIVAAALAASAGTAGVVGTMDHQPAPVSERAPEPQSVVVKHPLPPGVAEEDVQKWVPNRRVSGRTELSPWQSVDAARTRNPEVLRKLLQPTEAEVALDQTAERELVVDEGDGVRAGSVREARRFGAAGTDSGAFPQLSEMLSEDGNTSASSNMIGRPS
jgi:hypothetical protein